MSLISKGIDWLNAQRVTHLSETVTYKRAGYTPVSLAASYGSSDFRVADESGFQTTYTSIDFLVSSASLVLDGAVRAPEVSDRIEVLEAGTLRTYEVLDVVGQGCYRRSDPMGKVLRIHTKLVI